MKKVYQVTSFVSDKSDLRGWRKVDPPHFAEKVPAKTKLNKVTREMWFLHEDIFAYLQMNEDLYNPTWFLGFYNPSGQKKTSLPLKVYDMQRDVNKKYITYK